VNQAAIDAIPTGGNLLERNTAASPDAQWSLSINLDQPDSVSQATLDQIIWHSVKGGTSVAPPPGPGASGEDEEPENPDADR